MNIEFQRFEDNRAIIKFDGQLYSFDSVIGAKMAVDNNEPQIHGTPLGREWTIHNLHRHPQNPRDLIENLCRDYLQKIYPQASVWICFMNGHDVFQIYVTVEVKEGLYLKNTCTTYRGIDPNEYIPQQLHDLVEASEYRVRTGWRDHDRT